MNAGASARVLRLGLFVPALLGWAGLRTPQAQEPIAHWPLDTDGTEAVSGTAGTLEGDASITADGLVGEGALELDGDGDFLETGVDVPLDGEEMTVAFWFRKTGDNESGTFFVKSPGTAEDGAKSFFHEEEEVLIYDATNVGAAIGESPFGDSGWHHAAYTRVGDFYSIILDGVALAVEIEGDLGNEPDGDGHTVKLGFYEFDPGDEFPGYWDGLIDDVRVYDVALSEQQVRALIDDALDCPDAGDTHCAGITVEGPDGDAAGFWTITVDASDESGDEIIYTLSAQKDVDPPPDPVITTQRGDNVFRTRLTAGSWDLTVTVDDVALCDDEADDDTCDASVDVSAAAEAMTGAWCLSEGSGTTAADSVGGNDAGLVDMGECAWVAGPRGAQDGALFFDGEDDVLLMDDPEAFFFHQSYTWSAWVRTTSDGTILAWSPHDDDWNPGSQALFIRDGLLTMDVGWIDAFEQDAGLNPTSVVDGEWHHVALTAEFNVDGFNEHTTFYIDGLPAGENTWDIQAQGVPENATFHAGVASLDFPEDPWFSGMIDEIRVWNFALSADEIEEVFADPGAGCAPTEPECDGADTHCQGITVEGPEGGSAAGVWTVTVDATDDGGDTIIYTVTAEKEDDPPQTISSTQCGENVFELRLSAGTWTIGVSVDDSLLCDDAAADADCADTEPFEVTQAVGELIGHWCFNDGEGLETTDVVGTSDMLFVEAMDEDAWVEGPLGGDDFALYFDGIDDYLIAENSEEFDIHFSDHTWAAWIRTEEPGGEGGFMQQGPTDVDWDHVDHRGGRSFEVRGGVLGVDVGWVGFLAGGQNESLIQVNDAEWHHVAMTVEMDTDGDNDTMKLWLDGELDAERSDWDIGSQVPNVHGDLKIGWVGIFEDAPLPYFRGDIDDVRVFNFALDQDQLVDLMESPGDGCFGGETVSLKPGDTNGDAGYNISDPVAHLNFLFGGSALPECYVVPGASPVALTDQGLAILDFNGDGASNIADAVASLNFLFGGGDAHALGEECALLAPGSCSDNCE